MYHISISEELKRKIEIINLGVLQCSVDVQESPEPLIDLLVATAAEIEKKEAIEDIARLPQVHATREAYKALGKKPARYRVSSEALHRRIVQGKGLYFINNVVDINNLISIKSGCGICLYDTDKIRGDIVFRIAGTGETYRGIGKYDLNLEKLPVFSDDLGAFGTPTSDSERTMITSSTKNVLFVMVSFQNDSLNPWLDQAEDLIRKFAKGKDFERTLT